MSQQTTIQLSPMLIQKLTELENRGNAEQAAAQALQQAIEKAMKAFHDHQTQTHKEMQSAGQILWKKIVDEYGIDLNTESWAFDKATGSITLVSKLVNPAFAGYTSQVRS
jgi:hypothetical protein